MKIVELTKEKFEEFADNNQYNNYCQTSNYGIIMSETGFDYSFIGYTSNDNEILAAGMFLTKKIGKFYYAYAPKGFLIDYTDSELLKKFVHSLVKYYKKKKVIFLKINPEIPIATIDQNNNFERTANDNENILEELKALGFKKRKEIKPLELLQPKLVALINLKEYDINNLDKKFRNKIRSTENKGLEIEIADATKIDILYEFVKNMKDRSINYYRNIYNTFKKDNQADLILVKI